MADVIDHANDVASQHLAAALSACKTAAGRGPIWRQGKAFCRECDEEISPARVKALPGVELCIECAKERESWR